MNKSQDDQCPSHLPAAQAVAGGSQTPGPWLLTITQNEPEGWEKAFEVSRDGKHIAWFSFLDSAETYVKEYADAMPGECARAAIAKSGGTK